MMLPAPPTRPTAISSKLMLCESCSATRINICRQEGSRPVGRNHTLLTLVIVLAYISSHVTPNILIIFLLHYTICSTWPFHPSGINSWFQSLLP
jgi:hypothetical protein